MMHLSLSLRRCAVESCANHENQNGGHDYYIALQASVPEGEDPSARMHPFEFPKIAVVCTSVHAANVSVLTSAMVRLG